MALLSLPLQQRVQSFLSAQGAQPSKELSRTYEQILSMMQRKRDDDEFWKPLTELARDLVDSVVHNPESHATMRPEARLLALWDVRELAQLLRLALPHESTSPGGAKRPVHDAAFVQLTRNLTPSALGLFLLISLAACACDPIPPPIGASGGNTSTGGSPSTGGSGAGGFHGFQTGTGGATSSSTYATVCERDASTGAQSDAGYPLPANCCTDTATELWDAIDGSSLPSSDKQTLYACLVNLNASWCDGLAHIFQTGSPSEIATYLSQLLTCCDGSGRSNLTGNFEQARQALISGALCMAVLYKGVTFPN